MSVYVGIDVHRKRSQVAVVTEDGTVELNKNVVNGSEPMLRLIGDLPSGTPVAFEAAFGWGWLVQLLEDYGFEPHMGTNHLGHFALTCLLGDKIKDRVISVASAMYLFARIHFDDLNWQTRRYSKNAAYSESKLANLLFVQELANRGMRAYASDPGMTDTGITREIAAGIPMAERSPVWRLLHTPAQGARASLQAVTTDLPSGTYLAPRFNQWGKPRVTGLRKKARDPVAARQLWELSAELTGCDWR